MKWIRLWGVLLLMSFVWTPAESVFAQGTDPKGSDTIQIEVVKFKTLQETVLKHRGKVVVVDAWSTL